jgi:type VII secretion integral membrane protein EccD
MLQGQAGPWGFVCVSIASCTRRVDLVVPGAVPVAELVPELARSVGVLDAMTVYAGYRLVRQDGRVLANDSGLISQGVEDGHVLTVAAGVHDEPVRVYDDVVEAMSDVDRDFKPWNAAVGRRITGWVAVGALAMGAGALLPEHGSRTATAVSVVVTFALVLAGVVLSRVQRATGAAVTVALVGCGYAAVSGLMLAWSTPFLGSPVAYAGGGALVAGLVAVLGLAEGRSLLLPPVITGAAFVATGLLVDTARCAGAVAFSVVLVLVVMAGSGFPWLALGTTGTRVEPLLMTVDIDETFAIDPARIRVDAKVAHEILVGMSAAVGLLLVLLSPVAVSLGPAGALIAMLCSLVEMLRARRNHHAVEVLVGLTSGVSGLLATVVSAWWIHPAWRPATAISLVLTGIALLTFTRLPPGTSVRRKRLGDLIEKLGMLSLLPALVVATGAFSRLRG